MKRKDTVEKSCRLCEHAVCLADEQYCLCRKRGIVYSYGACRKFSADLLKFTPDARMGIPSATEYRN